VDTLSVNDPSSSLQYSIRSLESENPLDFMGKNVIKYLDVNDLKGGDISDTKCIKTQHLLRKLDKRR